MKPCEKCHKGLPVLHQWTAFGMMATRYGDCLCSEPVTEEKSDYPFLRYGHAFETIDGTLHGRWFSETVQPAPRPDRCQGTSPQT